MSNQNNPLEKEPFKSHSAKLKRVFIELHNYSFSHGTSEDFNSNDNFIGRERELEKFKSTLTDSSKKSGIYLVTGYRGMGKTSFVKKVLSDLFCPNDLVFHLKHWLFIVFIAFLITLLSVVTIHKISIHYNWILSLIYSIFTIILFVLYRSFNKHWTNILEILSDSRTKLNNLKHKILLEHLIILSFINTISILLYAIIAFYREIDDFKYLFYTLFFSYTSLIIFIIIIHSRKYLKHETKSSEKKQKSKNLLIKPIKNFVNHSSTIIINLNLGYSNLKEINILRLIARNIKSGFEQHRRVFSINKLLWFFTLLCIILFTSIVYNTKTAKTANKFLKNALKMEVYFPSQHDVYLYDTTNMLKVLVEKLETDSKYTAENYFLYNQTILKNQESIDSVLNYLKYFDNYLIQYLNIDEIQNIGSDSLNTIINNKSIVLFSTKLYLQKVFISKVDFQKIKTHLENQTNSNSKNNNILKDINVIEKIINAFISIYNEDTIFQKQISPYLYDKIKMAKDFLSNFDFDDKNAYSLFSSKVLRDNLIDSLINQQRKMKNEINYPNFTIKSDSIKLKQISSAEFVDLISYLIDHQDFNLNQNLLDIYFLYQLNQIVELKIHYSELPDIQKKVIGISNFLDYSIYQGYNCVRDILPKLPKREKINLLPLHTDYFYFFYIIIFYFLFKLFNRLVNFNRPTLRSVNKKLDFLNDLIDSNITLGKDANLGQVNKTIFGFSFRKNRQYTKADEREIEKYLIEVINDINHLPFFSYRSQFVIVFDELDKIEPVIEKENEKHVLYSPQAIRTRLQAVMGLLSNLKYFLSTAQSKFIFIAGREMYDASLADVSDRNFRLGSIFHDIFYIKSFYSDNTTFDIEHITGRTEQYVCSFLLPTNYSSIFNLNNYNYYLQKQHTELNSIEREKVIYLLHQFIVYLNHQSAGAPSKIKAFFEDHVRSLENMDNPQTRSIFVGDKESKKLFLFFDYYDQYKLGFINYLISPFNYTINRSIRNYGDKLIVSASFLHNHLFKFHRNSFSWRDLEATPEMIDINKNPELRDFLGRLLNFMSTTQIKEIINGIYDFKFSKRISQELLFLSHISEESSANFNFSLDESLIVKQHYKEQLLKLNEINGVNGINDKERGNYIYSVINRFLTLGDLCFYDGDFGEAITYYLEAIQSLRSKPVDQLSLTQLTLLTRNMLKLGYALEKRKTYDSAFLTYSEIADKILRWLRTQSIYSQKELTNSLLENVNYLYQPLIAKLYLIEKLTINGITKVDLASIYKDFDRLLDVLKRNVYFKEHFCSENRNHEEISNNEKSNPIEIELWKNVGNLLYYKNINYHSTCIHGLCSYDCKKNNETDKNPRPCAACLKYLDCFNLFVTKLGIEQIFTDKPKEHLFDISRYISSIVEVIKNKNEYVLTNTEYRQFAKLLSNIGNVFLSCLDKNEGFSSNFWFILEKYFTDDKELNEIIEEITRVEVKKADLIIINYISSAYFYRISNDHQSAANQYLNILQFLNTYIENHKGIAEKIFLNNNETPIIDQIANRAIKYIYCSYDHTHIYEVQLFKSIFAEPKNLNKKTFDDSKESNKEKNDLRENSDKRPSVKQNISIKKTSVNTDIEEINLIRNEIIINLGKIKDIISESLKDSNDKFLNLYHLVSPYTLCTNMYNRIQSLRFREKMNWLILLNSSIINGIDLTKLEGNKHREKFNEIAEKLINQDHNIENELIQANILYLISDSIFCCNEIIKISNTFDQSYSVNHSLLAETYFNFWKWSIYLTLFDDKGLNKQKRQIEEIIEKLIEPDNFHFVSPTYLAEKAITSWYDMKYTHQQGQAYRNLIENMYYLNDDFNDEMYHFHAAIERYKINLGVDEDKIKKLKKLTKVSSLYHPGYYLKDNCWYPETEKNNLQNEIRNEDNLKTKQDSN